MGESPGTQDCRRPKDDPLRYDAACAAALAGCGKGKAAGRLDEEGRARPRRQALDWLKSDLSLRARETDSGQPADREFVQQRLQSWQGDPDIAGGRDPEALAKQLPAEYADWQAFWQEVAALVTQAHR
jgi:hypothetical protein